MPNLPSGTVAFLFTDIEGSTRLWQHHADQMLAVYERHDEIIRTATTRHDGTLYKTIGDAFQIAFPSAPAALLAATEAQRNLQTERWSLPVPLRVRMAMHIATVSPTPDGDYRAPELNLLGRLLSAVHGGQVVLTQAVREHAVSNPPEMSYRDLGPHHFPGQATPVLLAQLTADGLRQDFPPLNTTTTRPTNLPQPPPPLVGRAAELDLLQTVLLRDGVRLLTIWGPDRVGKTSLALQAGRLMLPHVEDGAFLVELATITRSQSLPGAIASVLSVPGEPGQPIIESLIDYLTGKRLLLILDSLEQMEDPLPTITSILAHCPRVTMLVTSRMLLHSRWEHSFPMDTVASTHRTEITRP